MKKSVFVSALSALAMMVSVFVAAPASAQETSAAASASASAAAPSVTRGQEVFTAAGTRLGRVLRVNNDGSVRVAVDGAINNGSARLPADKISVQGETLVTSLTRAQVVALVR